MGKFMHDYVISPALGRNRLVNHQVICPYSHGQRGPRVVCLITQHGMIFLVQGSNVRNRPDRDSEMRGELIRRQGSSLVQIKFSTKFN